MTHASFATEPRALFSALIVVPAARARLSAWLETESKLWAPYVEPYLEVSVQDFAKHVVVTLRMQLGQPPADFAVANVGHEEAYWLAAAPSVQALLSNRGGLFMRDEGEDFVTFSLATRASVQKVLVEQSL